MTDGGRRLGLGVRAALALAALHLTACGGAEPVVFRHVFDDAPLDVTLRSGEAATEAVTRFRATGRNPYVGRAEAASEGKRLYEQWCQSCHKPDGSGWMGPSLIDDQHNYPRTGTDVGMFEIVFAGGAGAMQSFRERLTQDEILKVIAYVRSLER